MPKRLRHLNYLTNLTKLFGQKYFLLLKLVFKLLLINLHI